MLPNITVTRSAIEGLQEKYRLMRRMRLEHAAHGKTDPKPALKKLAERFPGVLREIDELPMRLLEARLFEVEAVLQGDAPPSPWMTWMASYHGLMRAALRVRRLVRSAENLDDALVRISERYRAASDEPPKSFWTAPIIETVLRPAQGRLNPWVFERVADSSGISARAVEEALFLCRSRVPTASNGSVSQS